MTREEFFHLLPYIFSLALSMAVFSYTWPHRHVRGARVYSWFMAGQTLTILGFILELVSPGLSTKILWDKFQWVTDIFLVVIPFLIFSVQFSEYELVRPRLTLAYWLGLPILFLLTLLTDDLHHLLYPNPYLSADLPFPELKYDFTFVVYGFTLFYVYAANFFGIGLLIRRAIQPFNAHRLQYWTIALGFLIPLLLSIFALLGIYVLPQRDIAPMAFAVGNGVVAWGLFRYRLFDLVPIARERVIESMPDSIIVLDASDRVVDINQAGLVNVGKKRASVIGQPAQQVFDKWSDLGEKLIKAQDSTLEVSVNAQGVSLTYEIIISSIRDKKEQLLGRVFLAHDITARKRLEDAYRKLSEELEQRVHQRTEELRESSKRYHALFEQTHDAIFILDFQGNHLEANQRASDLLGYSYDELLNLSFRDTTGEILQSEEVLERLLKGDHIPLYERIFRKKNGELIPVEINVELVHDIHGNPLHIQSVIRDISERKRAEAALEKSEHKHRMLFESANDSIFIIKEGVFVECNSRTLEMFGCQQEDIIGKSPVDFSPAIQPDGQTSQEKAAEKLNTTLRGIPQSFEWKHHRFDQTPFDAEVSLNLLVLDDQTFIQAIVRDISERKRAEAKLAEAYDTTLEGWAKALELRDKETEGHSRRVTETTLAVARAMGFKEEKLVHIRRGAILHDIGKMGIPDDILKKEGPLTEEERAVIKKHPNTAFDLLKPIVFLEKALEIPHCHHEKWDGTGYPRGLKAEEIPLSARIFAAADVWDALSYDRPYNKAWPREKVVEYFIEQSGKHFDPAIIKLFLSMVEKGEI